MLAAILVSLGVVFLAELGDKSQLMTMTYALRHRWWVVLSGVGIASFLVHGLSVTIGHFLGLTLPERPIAFAAAIAFLCSRCGRGAKAATTSDERRPTGRRATPRAARGHLLVRAGRARRQDHARHRRTGQRPQLGGRVDRRDRGHGARRRRGDRGRRGAAQAAARAVPARLASVLFLLFGLWMLFDGALGWRWSRWLPPARWRLWR